MSEELKRIAWRYKDKREGDKVHHGAPSDAEAVKAWVDRLNEEVSQIEHWVADAPEGEGPKS